MEQIKQLKEKGTSVFKLAESARVPSIKKSLYRQACALYGDTIQAVLDYENQTHITSSNCTATGSLRPSLFLNLALANLKLLDFDAALLCCNASIQLINIPDLPLGQLEPGHISAVLAMPVSNSSLYLAVKALYRRSKCYQGRYEVFLAIDDITLASSLDPQNKEVIKEKQDILLCHRIGTGIQSKVVTEHVIDDTNNGGFCWQRRGHWSQTVTDATIYLPMNDLKKLMSIDNFNVPLAQKQLGCRWSVRFHAIQIVIANHEFDSLQKSKIELPLQYTIIPSDCFWTKNDLTGKIELHLCKAPVHDSKCSSGTSTLDEDVNWTPGCEWWARVFVGDESIDPLTCSVGTDVSQLPLPARERAEREHSRFLSLPADEQQAELGFIETMKQVSLSMRIIV